MPRQPPLAKLRGAKRMFWEAFLVLLRLVQLKELVYLRDLADDPIRNRPASIGSRGGMKFEEPDPICTEIDEAKAALKSLAIPLNRTPCVVGGKNGDWKVVWKASEAGRL